MFLLLCMETKIAVHSGAHFTIIPLKASLLRGLLFWPEKSVHSFSFTTWQRRDPTTAVMQQMAPFYSPKLLSSF